MLQRIKYSDIKSERVLRACTGVDSGRLLELSGILSAYYKKAYGICYFEMLQNLKITEDILFSDYTDIVFFVLYCRKVGNTYDVLGVCFGTSGATVHNNLTKFEAILSAALSELGHAPVRKIESKSEVSVLGSSDEVKLVDGVEFGIEKPKNKEVRDKSYSVKKKMVYQNYHN